jgi:xylitol oxidase
MRQDVYLNLPFSELKGQFETIMDSAYSVSLFTKWQASRAEQVWIKSRMSDSNWQSLGDEFYGATRATRQLRPVDDNLPAEQCTQQLGVSGAWKDRLPHFRMNFTPSHGEELQSEYFVPIEHAGAAIHAIDEIGDQLAPMLLISEIRTVAADNLWMSPCYQQDSVTLHFTWYLDVDGVLALLPLIEKQLEPFHMQPHWGKLFTMSPVALRSKYAKRDAFLDLCLRYDPNGKFRNDFLNTHIFD